MGASFGNVYFSAQKPTEVLILILLYYSSPVRTTGKIKG
jgi:hypothetical protein